LVEIAGRLFVIASTAARFSLDTTIYDPKLLMDALKTDGRISLDDIEGFYLVIFHRAVSAERW
jgi:hypothetical protein